MTQMLYLLFVVLVMPPKSGKNRTIEISVYCSLWRVLISRDFIVDLVNCKRQLHNLQVIDVLTKCTFCTMFYRMIVVFAIVVNMTFEITLT